MANHAYLFEARSIQPFLFASGRLADMVAGSNLLDELSRRILDQALQACEVDPETIPAPRRAGGAIYLLFEHEATARRFRALWRTLVGQLLPGIERVDCISSGDSVKEAIDAGLAVLAGRRNLRTAELPNPAPVAERNARTGEVAVARDRKRDREPVDAATLVKRRFGLPEYEGLASKFDPQGLAEWPNNFEQDHPRGRRFPLDEDRMVGLIHADGNGLGQILHVLSHATRQVPEHYVRLYRAFSQGMDAATCEAARHATQTVLQPHIADGVYPARPLVLGGDDMTLLVRADLAMDFTDLFIQAFEHESASMLQDLCTQLEGAGTPGEVIAKLPPRLTACAGITYLKSSQPFSRGYQLAESLCAQAKQTSRMATTDSTIPSSIAFHRIQATLVDDVSALQRQEVDRRDPVNNTVYRLGLAAYAVGQSDAVALPRLDSLRKLAGVLRSGSLNATRLRQLATRIHESPDLARKEYSRWRALAETSAASALRDFDRHLESLVGHVGHDLPFGPPQTSDHESAIRSSPLGDLLAFLAIHGHESRKEIT